MKLKNKICLPILTITASAAAITPFVVSCGGTTLNNNEFIPTIPKAIPEAEHDPYEQEEILQIYYDHIKQNPDIYIQDLKHQISTLESRCNMALFNALLNFFMEHEFNIDIDFNYQLNNLKIGKYYKISSSSINHVMSISLDIDFSLNINSEKDAPYIYYLKTNDPTGITWSGCLFDYQNVKFNNVKLHINNFPLLFGEYMDSTTSYGLFCGGRWVLSSAITLLGLDQIKNLPAWSFDMSISSGSASCVWDPGSDLHFENYNFTINNGTDIETLDINRKIFCPFAIMNTILFFMSSYHMSDFKGA